MHIIQQIPKKPIGYEFSGHQFITTTNNTGKYIPMCSCGWKWMYSPFNWEKNATQKWLYHVLYGANVGNSSNYKFVVYEKQV